jgi:hypothetical protein
MATFLFAYRAPDDHGEPSPEVVAQWRAWFDGLGANLHDLGKPVFETTTVGTVGPTTRLGGYSFVTADDLEAAATMAKGCPFVGTGGGVEVGLLGEPRG